MQADPTAPPGLLPLPKARPLGLFRRAMSYFVPDLPLILALVTLIGCTVALGLLEPWPIAVLLDEVLSPQPKSDPMHRLILGFLPAAPVLRIAVLALLGLVIKLLLDGVWLVRMMLNARIRYNGTARVQSELYNKLQELGPAYHKVAPQGDTLYRLGSDTLSPFGVLDTFIGSAVAVVSLVAMMAVMFTRSVPLTGFALSITPLLLLVNVYFGRRIHRRTLAAKQADSDLTTTAQRAVSIMSLIHAFNRQRHEAARFRKAVDRSIAMNWHLNWAEQLYPLAVQTIFALGRAGIFGYGGYLVYRDQFLRHDSAGMSIGILMVFVDYLGKLWDPLRWVTGFFGMVQVHAAGSRRVFHVLDLPVAIVDPPGALALELRPRALALRGVSFDYPDGTCVLRDVDIEVSPGQLVAFVGPSGVGKSTLLGLLMRFHDPTRGRVEIDGRDLLTVPLTSLRRHLALVSQDSGLLPTSIADNIAYGSPGATPAEIRAAAALAGAAEFIEALPEGYGTLVAEGGQNLSGGQRQRLAIARALLTQAPILILDEPTSALDPAAERHILETLEGLRGQRTIILVTHRLPAVIGCDQIFIMAAGRITEHGTHEDLFARSDVYAQMLKGTSAPGRGVVRNV